MSSPNFTPQPPTPTPGQPLPPGWEIQPGRLLPPEPEREGGWLGWVFALAVMGAAACLCASIILLAGFAGVRDAYTAISTQAVQTREAEVATQYARARSEIEAGEFELAAERLEFVATRAPGYRDAEQQLAVVQLRLSATPTFTPTQPEPPSATPPEQPGGTPDAPFAPATLYSQGESALGVALYEEAIAWFEALRQTDPEYRRAEVRQNLIDAYTRQGTLYLRGQNADGADRLAVGVQYIYRATDLGYSGPLITEADFVELFLTARGYLEGGLVEQARPVLNRLCELNCSWSYRGVSIEALVQQYGR
ncbi:MAG: hypothetical protein HC915_04230 [Anaerolineae bacterium]|nr:hypothetical protein [Anaerolineae bacterium]